MKWEKVKLEDISINIQTGPFGSQLHQYDYSETGTPVVMPKDLTDGIISEQSIARVSEDHVLRLNRHMIQKGDILYSRRGDVGRCALATEHEAGWLCGTGCLRITIDETIADSKFVFYQLQQEKIVGWVEKHAVGATMLNLNTTILSNIPLRLPPLEIQRRIADVLSAYDDLIENNRKQIKLLEEAAQRLYKEWFVDLRFPGREHTRIVDGIPEGWEKRKLSDVFGYVRGKSYSSKDLAETGPVLMVNLKNIRSFGGYNRNAEKYYVGEFKGSQLLSAGDIVMGVTDMTQERRLVGHVAIIPRLHKSTIFSMDLIKLESKSIQKYFLYSALQYGGLSRQIALLANGVNVLHLKPDAMSSLEMIIPDNSLMEQYHQIFGDLYEQIETLSEQCDLATQARDRLLPKLMGGDVEA